MKQIYGYVALAVMLIGIGTLVFTQTSLSTAFSQNNRPQWSNTMIGYVYGNGKANVDGSTTYVINNRDNTAGVWITVSGCTLQNGQQVMYQQDRVEAWPNQLRLIEPSNCHLILPTE